MLISDHNLGPQMPVTGILLIEPQVAITSPDPLPRLRDLVDHGGMQQRYPSMPIPSLQVRDEAFHQLAIAAHLGNLPHKPDRPTHAPRSGTYAE